jgi:molybdopterin-synthase adenylyltransferase
VLIDGTDNFETRFLLNDLAVQRGAPLVYAGVVGTTGLITTVLPAQEDEPTACLRCLFDEAPAAGSAPTCDTAGVLGPAVSIIAGFQTVEAMKILLGRFDEVNRSLLEVNAWTGAVRRIDTSGARRADCECCALKHFDYLDGAHASQTVSLCGKNAVQISPACETNIDLDAMTVRLTPHGRFISNGLLLRGLFTDERGEQGDPIEIMLFPTGRAIIKGTAEPARARSVYARYLGA